MIDWELVRGQPGAADIKAAVKAAEALPMSGADGKVAAQFPVYGKSLPPITSAAWADAKVKVVKLKDVLASNGQLDQKDLIWHIQHPFQAIDPSNGNAHPQLLKTKDGLVIIGGHHRLSALAMLGKTKSPAFVLKAKNLDKDGNAK